MRKLFESALERTPEDRADFINDACGDDKSLAESVRDLLAFHEHSQAFLDQPVLQRDLVATPEDVVRDSSVQLEHSLAQKQRKPVLLLTLGLGIIVGFLAVVFQQIASEAETPWSGLAFLIGSNTYGSPVTRVYPTSPAGRAGIKRGDLILTIDDAPPSARVETKAPYRVGQIVHFTLRRNTDTRGAILRLGTALSNPLVQTRLWTGMGALLVFVIVGGTVLWKRPAYLVARVFFLLCLTLACTLIDLKLPYTGGDPLGSFTLSGMKWSFVSYDPFFYSGLIAASLLLHFALLFPAPHPVLISHPFLPKWIYASPVLTVILQSLPIACAFITLTLTISWQLTTWCVTAALSLGLAVKGAFVVKRSGWRGLFKSPVVVVSTILLAAFTTVLGISITQTVYYGFGAFPIASFRLARLPVAAFVLVAFLASCGLVIRAYQRSTLEQRKQIRWPVWGIATYAATQAVSIFIARFSGFVLSSEQLSAVVEVMRAGAEISSAVLIPSSMAVAILRYRLMDVDIFIRSTAAYTLMAAFVLVGYLGLAGGIGAALVRFTGVNGDWIVIGSTLAIVGVLAPVKSKVQAYLDSRIFGEGPNRFSLTRKLYTSASGSQSREELFRRAVDDIQQELKTSCVFLAEPSSTTEMYRITAATGVPDRVLRAGSFRIPIDRPTVLKVESDDLPSETRQILRHARCETLVPVLSDGVPVAWIGVGQKLFNESSRQDDRSVLLAGADMLSLAINTFRLREEQAHLKALQSHGGSWVDITPKSQLRECLVCRTCYDGSIGTCELDGTVVSSTLPVGRTIDGRYRLERRIGSGGMSAVYEALDLTLGRTVAVKIMLGQLFGNPTALRRFAREGKAIASLRHPNIIEIYDFGLIGTDGAFLVMPRLYGSSARSELQSRGLLAPANAAAWLDQVLDGLEAAHRSGIVHCDLKPENIVISPNDGGREHITILDFGLARLQLLEDDTTPTVQGLIAGTPGYISPEQLEGRRVDERSDIFAVGVMTVELLTGKRPFHMLAYRHPPEWHRLRGPEFEAVRCVLTECLAIDPDRRTPNVRVLRSNLISALRKYAE
jgi:hypothetical protein